jgi:murein DD-endopeptidase MepM/ murein hydrolase activator NlpD
VQYPCGLSKEKELAMSISLLSGRADMPPAPVIVVSPTLRRSAGKLRSLAHACTARAVGAVFSAGSCLLAPVSAPVTDPFRQPVCGYCPGNRGIEYAPLPNTPVQAAAAGVVAFAGSVAGTSYVVVDQSGGYRATYGKLATIGVAAGQQVATGQILATTSRRFYFGLRLGDRYIDPAPIFGRLVFRPQLVPLDGNNRRPPPPPRLLCT